MARLTDGSILALGSGRMWMRDVKRDTFVTVAPDLNVSYFLRRMIARSGWDAAARISEAIWLF